MSEVVFQYDLTDFPQAAVDGYQLMQECTQKLGVMCRSVSQNADTQVVTISLDGPAPQQWVDDVVRQHKPNPPTLPPLRLFAEQHPRHWWALERMFDADMESKIKQAIREGEGEQYLGYLWDIGTLLETKLKEHRDK